MKVSDILSNHQGVCPYCGLVHETAVRDVCVYSGAVNDVGTILKRNSFPYDILLVADKQTLKASEGIIESLSGFKVDYKIYDTIRVATMDHVDELCKMISGKNIGILSVGTGSVNDPCRLAAAREGRMLAVFGTAPSMDGFASYSSPIVKDGFKASYAAKSPEVIIADTKILADSPSELKSAGFGDMMAKYVALIDWKLSEMLIGEKYCPFVAGITREATDELLSMADKVTVSDEQTAGMIFESLLKTGIGMSFMKNSRPASGCEHVISHLMECIELRDGIIPNYHGEDIGVSTLAMLRYYNALADRDSVGFCKDFADWDDIYSFYGNMADDVRKLNTPDTVTDYVDPEELKEKWNDIRSLIRSVPGPDIVEDAMRRAGCRLTVKDIGKSQKLFDDCVKYSPYMRRRLTLLRMKNMII
ncbi:MAG: iron-containing alcohol dehydrogenase [Clostridia bacterium]|nr:iron-containing alcohol dehydrogenase [Clostridia bacterium]